MFADTEVKRVAMRGYSPRGWRVVEWRRECGPTLRSVRGGAVLFTPPAMPAAWRGLRSAGALVLGDFGMRMLHDIDGQRGMRIGGAGTHFRCHPDRLHDLLFTRAVLHGLGGMPLDAIRALGGVGDRHGNELLSDIRQGAIGKHGGTESLECLQRFRRELTALARNVDGGLGVQRCIHNILLGWPAVAA